MIEKRDEINLKDIIFYCLNRWYIFLLTSVVMIVCVWSVQKELTSPDEEAQAEEVYERAEAEKTYERAVEYYENSFLMDINPLEVYVDSLSYDIVLDTDSENDKVAEYEYIKALISRYKLFIESGELARKMADELSVNEKFINEILSVEDNMISFTVQIIGKDSLNVKPISEEVERQIKNYTEEMNQSGWEYQLKLSSHMSKEVQDMELYTWQQQVSTYITKLTVPELVKQNEILKKIILLVICDWILVIAVLLTIYLYGGAIHSHNSLQISLQYDLSELGRYIVTDKKKKFSKQLRYSDVVALGVQECAKMLAIKIGIECFEKKVFFTSSSVNKKVKDVITLTIEKLGEKGISAEYIEEIQKKPNELEKIMEVQEREIILIEQIESSRIKAFETEMDLYVKCKMESQKIIFLY